MLELILILIGGTLAILALILIVYFMRMDTIIRAKFKRALSGKPYGVAYFHIGQQIFPRLINFEADTVQTKNRLWVISKEAVHVQKKTTEGKFDEAKQVQNADEFQRAVLGVPTIHFDNENCVAMSIGEVTPDKIPKSQQIQATMKKELEYAEAELMYHHRDKLKKLIIVVLILTIASIAISGFRLFKIVEIAGKLAPAVSG